MIKEITIYTLVCDNCKIDIHKDHEFSGYDDLDYVRGVGMDSNWHRDDDKHFCDDCWYWDDEDNIRIDTRRYKSGA
jgi:hypothetical protein